MRKKDTKFIEIKTPCQEDLANMDASTSNTIELKFGSHIVRTLHRSELPMEDCQIFITPHSPMLKGDVIIRK